MNKTVNYFISQLRLKATCLLFSTFSLSNLHYNYPRKTLNYKFAERRRTF
jgi:hypothetical protein